MRRRARRSQRFAPSRQIKKASPALAGEARQGFAPRRLVIALRTGSVNLYPGTAIAGITTEMVAVVTVPSALAIGVVERAVLAPIAVVERAVGAVVIAIIISSAADGGAHPVMVAIGAAGKQQSRQPGNGDQPDKCSHG